MCQTRVIPSAGTSIAALPSLGHANGGDETTKFGYDDVNEGWWNAEKGVAHLDQPRDIAAISAPIAP